MFIDDKTVKLEGGVVIWDGLNEPEQNKDMTPSYSLRIAFPANSQDVADFTQLCQRLAASGKFSSGWPQDANWPIKPVDPQAYGGMFPNHVSIRFKTNYFPSLFSEEAELPQGAARQVIYPGQHVSVLAHAFDYNTAGNKGISGGLDSVRVSLRANAPRAQFGDGNASKAAVWGVPAGAKADPMTGYGAPGAGPAGNYPSQPGYAPQPAAAPGYAPQPAPQHSAPSYPPQQAPAYMQPGSFLPQG